MGPEFLKPQGTREIMEDLDAADCKQPKWRRVRNASSYKTVDLHSVRYHIYHIIFTITCRLQQTTKRQGNSLLTHVKCIRKAKLMCYSTGREMWQNGSPRRHVCLHPTVQPPVIFLTCAFLRRASQLPSM